MCESEKHVEYDLKEVMPRQKSEQCLLLGGWMIGKGPTQGNFLG
jgi:hypothetical protein